MVITTTRRLTQHVKRMLPALQVIQTIKKEANLCLMVDGEVESIVSSFDSEIELDENYDKRLDAFNEMHEEAKKLSQANNFLKGKLRCHVDKIVSC